MLNMLKELSNRCVHSPERYFTISIGQNFWMSNGRDLLFVVFCLSFHIFLYNICFWYVVMYLILGCRYLLYWPFPLSVPRFDRTPWQEQWPTSTLDHSSQALSVTRCPCASTPTGMAWAKAHTSPSSSHWCVATTTPCCHGPSSRRSTSCSSTRTTRSTSWTPSARSPPLPPSSGRRRRWTSPQAARCSCSWTSWASRDTDTWRTTRSSSVWWWRRRAWMITSSSLILAMSPSVVAQTEQTLN